MVFCTIDWSSAYYPNGFLHYKVIMHASTLNLHIGLGHRRDIGASDAAHKLKLSKLSYALALYASALAVFLGVPRTPSRRPLHPERALSVLAER